MFISSTKSAWVLNPSRLLFLERNSISSFRIAEFSCQGNQYNNIIKIIHLHYFKASPSVFSGSILILVTGDFWDVWPLCSVSWMPPLTSSVSLGQSISSWWGNNEDTSEWALVFQTHPFPESWGNLQEAHLENIYPMYYSSKLHVTEKKNCLHEHCLSGN